MIINKTNKKGSILLGVFFLMSIVLLIAISLINYNVDEKQIERSFKNYKKNMYKSESLSFYVVNLIKNADTESLKSNNFIWLNKFSTDLQNYKNWNNQNSSFWQKDQKCSFLVLNKGIKRASSVVLINNQLKPYEFIIYSACKEKDFLSPQIVEVAYVKYL